MVQIVEMAPEQPGTPPPPQQQPPAPPQNDQNDAANEEDDDPPMDKLRQWVNHDNGWLSSTALAWLNQRTGYSKWGCFWSCSAICGLIMARTPALAPLLSNTISVGTYAMTGMLAALGYRQWDDVGNWLVYFLIFQAFSCLDFLAKTNSPYYPAKTTLLAFFHLPPLFGARYLRRRWIDPMVYEGYHDFLVVMKRAHPWLLHHVYDLDRSELDQINEQRLRDYVMQTRENLWHAVCFQPTMEVQKPDGSTAPRRKTTSPGEPLSSTETIQSTSTTQSTVGTSTTEATSGTGATDEMSIIGPHTVPPKKKG